MNAVQTPHHSSVALEQDDERSLLNRLALLLEQEDELLVARDPIAIGALAEEREQVTERLGQAARARHARTGSDVADQVELVELYQRLRRRHDVRAQVLCRHSERNARAVGVLAQATGQGDLYRADGRVAMTFVAI